jgi:hypothetical protein
MATGAPATVVSGVGAANMVLRDFGLPGYDRRKFPQQYVTFVETPYQRPTVSPNAKTDQDTAWLAAAECQGCQKPNCVCDCPAGIDIPGVLRRMEAKNYSGAARELQQRNPFGSLCGVVCPAENLCEQHCNRRTFTGRSVRIADLMRWVSQFNDQPELLKMEVHRKGPRSIVLGGNLNGLTCAYYLALAGFSVDLIDSKSDPLQNYECNEQGINQLLAMGVQFKVSLDDTVQEVNDLKKSYSVGYIASDEWALQLPDLTGRFELPQPFTSGDFSTPAHAISEGRRAAFVLSKLLPAGSQVNNASVENCMDGEKMRVETERR